MFSRLLCAATVMIAMSTMASAADSQFTCRANGKSFSGNGESVTAKAIINFDETVVDGLRTLTNITGSITIDPNTEVWGNPYTGQYDIASLTENPKFKPQKYVGFSQFREFNSLPSEDYSVEPIWGNFLVAKDTTGRFAAHYLIQAGDHMGGTLHLTCRAN